MRLGVFFFWVGFLTCTRIFKVHPTREHVSCFHWQEIEKVPKAQKSREAPKNLPSYIGALLRYPSFFFGYRYPEDSRRSFSLVEVVFGFYFKFKALLFKFKILSTKLFNILDQPQITVTPCSSSFLYSTFDHSVSKRTFSSFLTKIFLLQFHSYSALWFGLFLFFSLFTKKFHSLSQLLEPIPLTPLVDLVPWLRLLAVPPH